MTSPALRAAPWGVLVVIAGNLLLDTIEVSSLFVLLPAAAADLRLGPVGVALVAAAFPTGFLAGIPLAAPVAGRLGLRTVLVGSLLAFAAATVLSAFAGGAAIFAAARLVKGVSAGLTTPLGNRALAASFADAADRGRATALYTLVGGGGFVAGLLLTAPLVLSSWQVAACWPAPVALALAVLASRSMRALTGPTGRTSAAAERFTSGIARGAVIPAAAGVGLALAPLPPALRVAGCLLAAGAVMLVVLAPLRGVVPPEAARAFAINAATAALFNGSFLFFFAVAQQRLQLTSLGPLAALATIPVGLGMALAVPLTGALTRWVPLNRLVAASAACAGVAYLACAFAAPPSVASLVAVSALVGVAFVLGFAPLNLRAVAAVPVAVRATALGSYQILVQVGAALALPLGAAGVALLGGRSGAWAVAPVLVAAGVALFVAAGVAVLAPSLAVLKPGGGSGR